MDTVGPTGFTGTTIRLTGWTVCPCLVRRLRVTRQGEGRDPILIKPKTSVLVKITRGQHTNVC